jgi:hypothetical protein
LAGSLLDISITLTTFCLTGICPKEMILMATKLG